MSRTAVLAGVAVLAIAVVAVAAVLWNRPGELQRQPVGSVPALLSAPAGVPGGGLTLRPDGLGDIEFGTPEDEAYAALVEALGEPIEDEPQPCDSETDTVRFVRWGNLSAAFPDGAFGGYIIGIYFRMDSPELPLETEEGVALRAPATELVAAYGDRLAWIAQEDMGFEAPVEGFGIDGFDVDTPTPTGIGGFVEGGREEGQVITFFAGQPCGAA